MAKVARLYGAFNDLERNSPVIKSCDLTYWDLEVENVFLKIFFSLNIFLCSGCPTSGCALPRPRRKRAGRGGGTRDKNPDRGPSRSDSFGFPLPPRAAETVKAGAPGTAALLSHPPGVANGCRGPGCSGPGRSGEGPSRPRPLAAPTSPAPALRK